MEEDQDEEKLWNEDENGDLAPRNKKVWTSFHMSFKQKEESIAESPSKLFENTIHDPNFKKQLKLDMSHNSVSLKPAFPLLKS